MTIEPFIKSVALIRARIDQPNVYPFSLPAVRALDGLSLSPVTYFVGENGSGKSTLLEAIAIAAGFNAEGGTTNVSFSTRRSESALARCIRLGRSARRARTGFFLRAESFFNLATEIERLDSIPANSPPVIESYGGRSLHEQSHGESFLALIKHRFGGEGFYVLDEPEAALSAGRQLALLRRMHELVAQGSQFLVATHAPIVLSYPEARIYRLDEAGITLIDYEEAEQVSLTRDFLNHRERYLHALFQPEGGEDAEVPVL